MKSILKSAVTNSIATALYIVLVAMFLFYAGNNQFGGSQSVLIPIFMLMLFVFSAALTGTLILGKPVLLYLEGKKKEAVTMIAYTLGVFFFIMLIALVLLLALPLS